MRFNLGLAKLSLIIYMADTLVTHRHELRFWYGVVPFLGGWSHGCFGHNGT